MNRFGMLGKLSAQPGQRDALLQILLSAAAHLGTAPGCDLYVIAISPTEADAIWVTEAWRSEADHDASLAMVEVRDLIAQARPLIADMSEPILTVPVGGVGLPS
jgi:quinol monooxygenase YgiN